MGLWGRLDVGRESLELEAAIVGAVLRDPSTAHALDPELRGEHFYYPTYGDVFDVVVSLVWSGQAPTPAVVAAELERRQGSLEVVAVEDADAEGDYRLMWPDEELARLAAMAPGPAHAAYYAGVVLERAREREARFARRVLCR